MDIDTILQMAGVGIGSGLTAGTLLMFILKMMERRINKLEKKTDTMEEKSSKCRLDMTQAMSDQEDCVESELIKMNTSIGKIENQVEKVVTVLRLTSDNPDVKEILKPGS